MKIAVIPFADFVMNDGLFLGKERDNLTVPWKVIQECLVKYGHEIHTIDMYQQMNQIDYILITCENHLFQRYYPKIIFSGKGNRIIYLAQEPEVVNHHHSIQGMKVLLKKFPCILTWNDDAIDEKKIFKIVPPVYYSMETDKGENYENRKLLVGIWGDMPFGDVEEKPKNTLDEYGGLTGERRRVVDFFEKQQDDVFDAYGFGWPEGKFINYKGSPVCKSDVYKEYRFAICLENQGNVKGCISEKIADCFNSGIVPIYGGATNISEYIPQNCFIDYFSFSSFEELVAYLQNVSKEDWQNYLEAVERFRASEQFQRLQPERIAEKILNVIDAYNKKRSFSLLWGQWHYAIYLQIQRIYLKYIRKIE